MLRAAAAAMIIANLLFFGWSSGWFAPVWPAPHFREREPERLAAQLRPEAVTVLAPRAASAALSEARAAVLMCLEAGPFNEAVTTAAESALRAAQVPEGRWVVEPVPAPPGWLVFGGRYPEAATRHAREDELRKLGIAFEPLAAAAAPPELVPGIVLSRHASREAAEAALAALAVQSPRLRGARVVQLPPPPLLQWLRVTQAEPELAERLKALPVGGFKPCAAPRG